MKSKSNYEKRLEYNNTYNRNNYRSFSMRLHNENEADLIEWIESQDSVKEYLLSLVRKDIEKSKNEYSTPPEPLCPVLRATHSVERAIFLFR